MTETSRPSTRNTSYDLEGRLRTYFPVFFELLGDNKLNWKRAAIVFTKKVDKWLAKHEATGKPLLVEASFYHIITAAIQGNQAAVVHLEFIRKLFEDLIRRLDPAERRLIGDALYGMLTNMNRAFRNFLGELCVLNNVKGNTEFKLTAVEIPAILAKPNGPSIDFRFFHPIRSTFLLVEVVNIHLTESAHWDDEKVMRLLEQKIQHKLNITGIRESQNFNLIPVFWGSFEELKRINQFYLERGIKFQNTMEPAGFAVFSTPSGKRYHVFGAISQIIAMHESSQKQ